MIAIANKPIDVLCAVIVDHFQSVLGGRVGFTLKQITPASFAIVLQHDNLGGLGEIRLLKESDTETRIKVIFPESSGDRALRQRRREAQHMIVQGMINVLREQEDVELSDGNVRAGNGRQPDGRDPTDRRGRQSEWTQQERDAIVCRWLDRDRATDARTLPVFLVDEVGEKLPDDDGLDPHPALSPRQFYTWRKKYLTRHPERRNRRTSRA